MPFSLMAWISLLARLLLIAVFLIAAVGKLADREGSRQAVLDFGIPRRLAALIATLLPFAELAIAALLISGASARWGALAALGLLGLFIIGIAVNLARGKRPNCHCFGQLHSKPLGWSTLFRNGTLAVLAGVVLWRGGEGPAIAFGSSAGASAATWAALVAALIALAIAAIEGWLLLNLLPQQGRIMLRLEALETALGQGGGTGLLVGHLAPEFELRSIGGDRITLAALRAQGRPVLLVFTNPDCAPCDAVLDDVSRWQREHADRLNIALISRGSIEANRAKAERYALGTVLLQKRREVVRAYQVESTPAAILVSAAGRIASRVGYGADGVEELLERAVNGTADAAQDLVPSRANGRRHPSDGRASAIGQPAPALTLPDLDGKVVDLAGFQGTSTLVLFWSPACTFCQRMLPELKRWEQERPAESPRLLIVSTGTVEANRAMGLSSPVVLDAEGSAMHRFGANGTPMAVLVDADGKIASSVLAGAQNVMALAGAHEDVSARRW